MAGEDMIMIRQEEIRRLHVIQKVLDGIIKQVEAAEILSLSRRQIRRIVKRIRSEGSRGIIHRLRGRPSNARVSDKIKERVTTLYRTQYKAIDGLEWLIQTIRGPQTVSWTEKMRLRPEDTTELLSKVANGPQRERKKALILLGRMQRISINTLCLIFSTSRATVRRDWRKFNDMGAEGFFRTHPRRVPKAEDETIKAAVFSVIHSPPSEHNINRTSWKFEDIRRCLSQQGIHVSKNLISKIIRRAGYKWRKAKTVLTSNDPKYREKLDRIKSILSTLGENDRFCSIDEFGPFAVKIKGGKRLVGPNEYPQVPQFQKSKGWLIVTAALELSQNQVTHFYSKAKNTTEMIKLLEVLLERYRGCDRLYFSWDAALFSQLFMS
jgi:transposase